MSFCNFSWYFYFCSASCLTLVATLLSSLVSSLRAASPASCCLFLRSKSYFKSFTTVSLASKAINMFCKSAFSIFDFLRSSCNSEWDF